MKVNAPSTEWPEKRLKFIAPLRNERADATSEHPDYVGLENIQSWTGKYFRSTNADNVENNESVSGTANVFYAGDVLFGKLRPYLAKALHANKGGVCSTELLVMNPESDMHSRFLFYSMLSPDFVGKVDASTFGAKMPRANWEFIGSMKLPVPDYLAQQLIADYLDRETAHIDALVEKKEKMLVLLEEKRAALISRAVTRGLNPSVPLQPSGLDWLGDIPEHWRIIKLKYVGEPVLGLTFSPDNLVNEDEGVLVLRASNVKNGRIVLEDNIYVDMEFPEKLRTRVDDIVICSRSGSRALIGKNALIDNESSGLTFGAFMTVFRSNYNKFLYWVFNSTLFDYQAGAFGTSTINQLTTATLDNMEVPIPPEEEQRKITAYLIDISKKFDVVISSTRNSIDLAKERRAALITAAVTGQIPIEEMRV